VERCREEFLVRRACALGQRGELDAKKELAPLERCLEEIGEESVERDAPFGEPGLRDSDAVEREERHRRILRRVSVCEIATERRLLADPHGRDRRERRRECRGMPAYPLRARERAECRERSEGNARIGYADLAKLRYPAQSEHALWPHEVLLHQDHERRAPGHDEGVIGIAGEDLERLAERFGLE